MWKYKRLISFLFLLLFLFFYSENNNFKFSGRILADVAVAKQQELSQSTQSKISEQSSENQITRRNSVLTQSSSGQSGLTQFNGSGNDESDSATTTRKQQATLKIANSKVVVGQQNTIELNLSLLKNGEYKMPLGVGISFEKADTEKVNEKTKNVDIQVNKENEVIFQVEGKITTPVKVIVKTVQTGTINLALWQENIVLSNKVAFNVVTEEETVTAKIAAQGNSIDDGITDWSQVVGGINVLSKVYLDKDADLLVTLGNMAQTTNVLAPASGYSLSYQGTNFNGKISNINLGIKEGNTAVQDIFFGTNLDVAAPTSLGFGVTFKKDDDIGQPGGRSSTIAGDERGIADLSVLYNEMTAKSYFVKKDASGTVETQKITGTYIKKSGAENENKFDVEILLRKDSNNPGQANLELYLKNIGKADQGVGVMFTGDTFFSKSGDMIDLKTIGQDKGLYVEGAKTSEEDTLKVLFKVGDQQDSATSYNVFEPLQQNLFNAFTPKNFSGSGLEGTETGKTPGIPLEVPTKDSGFISKWPFKTISPGETAHFQQDVQVLIGNKVLPNVDKTYTNSTSSDGKNRVGDTISYKLSVANMGYGKDWFGVSVSDQVPKGMAIDVNTLKKGDQKIPESDYSFDSATRILTVKNIGDLKPNVRENITFDAVIEPINAGRTVINTFTASGTDNSGKVLNSEASVPLNVEKGSVTVNKQVKNETTTDPNFVDSITASVGDQVSYRVKVELDKTQKLDKGTILTDVVKGSLKNISKAKITYRDASGTAIGANSEQPFVDGKLTTGTDVPTGGSLLVEYTADVGSAADAEISNTMSVKTLDDKEYPSNEAIIKVKNSATVDKLTQTVENITAKLSETDQELEGSDNDVIRYAFTAHVKADDDAKLKSFVLDTQENDKSHITDSDGELNTDSDQYDFQYQLKGETTWTDLDKTALKEVTGGVQITLPDDQVTLGDGDTISVRYSKSIKTAPVENKYLYNDGSVGNVEANSTKIKMLSDGNITVRYVDLDENLANPDVAPTQLKPEVHATGKIGTTLSSVISGRNTPKVITDYTILWVTEETDLTKDNIWSAAYKDDPKFSSKDRIITYGYRKAMITINAPSAWDFGIYNPTQSDSTYYLTDKKEKSKVPQRVSVSDYYGVAAWDLTVQQNSQFVDNENHELTAAQLRITEGNVTANATNTVKGDLTSKSQFNLNPGAAKATKIMSFKHTGTFQGTTVESDKSDENHRYTDPGLGVWYYNFGTGRSTAYSVGLYVPATTKRYKTHYTTELTWSVTVAP